VVPHSFIPPTLHTAHCTLHTPLFTLPTSHCTLHAVHSTIHTTPHCTMHAALSTIHTTNISLHTAHFTIHTTNNTQHTARYTLHNSHNKQHTAHCTLHTPQFTKQTPHCTQHAARSTIHTTHIHFTLRTAHCTLHTKGKLSLHPSLLHRNRNNEGWKAAKADHRDCCSRTTPSGSVHQLLAPRPLQPSTSRRVGGHAPSRGGCYYDKVKKYGNALFLLTRAQRLRGRTWQRFFGNR
jgi:hypothetical protein